MYTVRFYLKYLLVRCRKISDDFFLLKIFARDTLDNYHLGSRHTCAGKWLLHSCAMIRQVPQTGDI